jgi:prevent-host-death family protein
MNKHVPKSAVRNPAWSLQDAKAKFSEVVRRACEEGPQRVSVHGKEKVVVLSAEEFAALSSVKRSGRTGQVLIDAMRDRRLPKDFTFERQSVLSPIRNVDHLFDDSK